MAHAPANHTLSDLIHGLHELLPDCAAAKHGQPCVEPSQSGRGFAVYAGGERVCFSDILLPGFNMLPRWLLGGIYLVFLLYLFVGVSMSADMFMDGIMQITSIMKKVKRKKANGEVVVVEEPVWNWVVANISLMALGSAAAEVMLALIEALITLNKPAGELGPSCIVGAASFNQLIVAAVSTTALPHGVFKSIEHLRVYVTTACWSIAAHIWLLVVYWWWTPDEITVVEGLLTFCFTGVVILHAWIMDTQPWKRRVYADPCSAVASQEEAERGIKMPDLPSPTGSGEEEQAAKNAAFFQNVMEQRTAHGLFARLRAKAEADELSAAQRAMALAGAAVPRRTDRQQVMFRSTAYSCLESAGVVRVAVMRLPPLGGTLGGPLRVFYTTDDGDAIAGLDYVATQGVLTFAPGEGVRHIEVQIVDDDVSEPDVTFSVVLTHVEDPGFGSPAPVILQNRVHVTIVDDDDAGVVGFELPHYEARYSQSYQEADMTVVRRRGTDGRVEVEYMTVDETALAGRDYEAAHGRLVLESGQKSCRLHIKLLPLAQYDLHKAFRVELQNPGGGVELSSRCSTRVTIAERSQTGRPATNKGGNMGASRTGSVLRASGSFKSIKAGPEAEPYDIRRAWRSQIKAAFEIDEDDDGEDDGAASSSSSGVSSGDKGWGALIMHYVKFSWQIILAIMVPPPEWNGGYPTFGLAILALTGQVYLVNESAKLFGCIVGLKDLVTGFSIVALGTSLPDTFASRIAAQHDATADSAIGNITGSNCMNVFVGLGLPWVICSIYYKMKGERYVTPAGDLAFSVLIFCIVGCTGMVILAVARHYGGELGGSKARQWAIASVLAGLWGLYLALSGLRAYGNIGNIA